MKVYRGSAAAARDYVEADRARVDDYYLGEGTGLADRYVASPEGVRPAGAMDGDAYERWVAGYDVETGAPKGRLRTDEHGVRFAEVVVNGPKTWSLAAAVHPEIAAAYDAAQERAARQIIGWVAQHATTRVGPRDRQVQVPVEQIEAAVVRHLTSRAGDPHVHMHLQFSSRVWAMEKFRGLHTVGVRDSLDAINGIGHAAVMTDPKLRATFAAYGYRLDPESGEIVELADFVGPFSARSRQIAQKIDTYEAEWRGAHPGETPGPAVRRSWDRRAWADARPDKVVPTSGEELRRQWVEELQDMGFRMPNRTRRLTPTPPGSVDRDELASTALTRLGARRSAWNSADARGEVERLIAAADVVTYAGVRQELAEDVTARVIAGSVPLLERDDVPEHVRSYSSPHVLGVERDLIAHFTARGSEQPSVADPRLLVGHVERLDEGQRTAVALLAGTGPLLVIEGAAGAGKTATLAAARAVLARQRRNLVVVAPTRKAAQVAGREVGTRSARSAHGLLYQHGYRWDDDGRWWRVPAATPTRSARLGRRDVLVVDEAGMLDQDTARALLHLAAHTGARVALMGDRHQLPAVGRGGVLDLAARYAAGWCVSLEGVRRFRDPEYARISLRMRRGQQPAEVFDELLVRGEIMIHSSDAERRATLARLATDSLVMADTREQVGAINDLTRQSHRPPTAGGREVVTEAGETIGAGDRVATRRNDADADVANRETWTVTKVRRDGGLEVRGTAGRRRLTSAYVHRFVELAYATTVYGAQGETTSTAHMVVSEKSSASSLYVGMTRGRDRNMAHLVAESIDDAREQWVEAFGRDQADLGPAEAARRAAEAVERFGPAARRRTVSRGVQPSPYDLQLGGFPSRPSQSSSPSIGM